MNKNIIGIFIIFISYLSVYAQQPQLVPYRIGEKWGYSDTAGKIIFEPQYQSADFFVNDVAFVVYLVPTQPILVTRRVHSEIR